MEFSALIEKSRYDNIQLRLPRFYGDFDESSVGALAVTSHYIIFETQSNNIDKPNEFRVLHQSIDNVAIDKGFPSCLKCTLKTFLTFRLKFNNESDCSTACRSITALSSLDNVELFYPLWSTCDWTVIEDGWQSYSVEQEFAKLQMNTRNWRLSLVNSDFDVCNSYPNKLVVPASVSDECLMASALFRDKGRFPVLSFHYRPKNAILLRCGQPLIGQNNVRCREDEQLLNAMLLSNNKGYILDTRSSPIIQSAKQRGGGSESDAIYNRFKKCYAGLPQSSQFRDMLVKHVEACESTDPDKYLSKLVSAGWLSAVQEYLKYGGIVAQLLHHEVIHNYSASASALAEAGMMIFGFGFPESEASPSVFLEMELRGNLNRISVVVHGSDGMDSTLIITCLAQLILDPDSRTYRGFQALIDREWLSGGHPFSTRCFRLRGTARNMDIAPTFILFLDCVFQLHRQYYCSFEFDEHFLIELSEQAYFSEYGSFLCDSPKQRSDLELEKKSVSFWSYCNHPNVMSKYLNCLYEPHNRMIWPSIAPQSIVLWERYFLRWSRDWEEENKIAEQTVVLVQTHKKQVSAVTKLRRQLIELEKEQIEQNNAVQIES